jgi:hypothetical protein
MSKIIKARKQPDGTYHYSVDYDGRVVDSGCNVTRKDLATLREYHNCNSLEMLDETCERPVRWALWCRLLLAIAAAPDESESFWKSTKSVPRLLAVTECLVWLQFVAVTSILAWG